MGALLKGCSSRIKTVTRVPTIHEERYYLNLFRTRKNSTSYPSSLGSVKFDLGDHKFPSSKNEVKCSVFLHSPSGRPIVRLVRSEAQTSPK